MKRLALLALFLTGCADVTGTVEPFRVTLDGRVDSTSGRSCTYTLRLQAHGGEPGDLATWEGGTIAYHIPVDAGRAAVVTATYGAAALANLWRAPGIGYGDVLELTLPTEFTVTHGVTLRLPTSGTVTETLTLGCG